MSATRFIGAARRGATLLMHAIHGGLLGAGLIAFAALAANLMEHGPLRYFDGSMAEAHAAVASRYDFGAAAVEPEPPTLSAEMERVRDYVARRYRVSAVALEPVLIAAEDSARSVGIDPLLVVAVIAVESSFNPYAESHVGAQGLMQVIPRFHMDKIGAEAGEDALFDPELNVRVGTLVIHEGLRRFGSLQAALQYYGGARGDPEAAYYRRVMAMKQRLAAAAGRGQATTTGV
ncbi:lytic transglycosylase domain-containing protein [Pseudothauera rhizosphaerae]|uniref:Transglycosylase n=1 Tax=Pseudothauera rhizosphaerae TaxID=2565932 RepID=A0A4S4AEV4_9RHOO|nr:lytic transglycosylase domain-containing protein [Pseudothauera rhizosphaerae]THF57688.1 transglycosylase [Pseudothauera rhizosphaerae]